MCVCQPNIGMLVIVHAIIYIIAAGVATMAFITEDTVYLTANASIDISKNARNALRIYCYSGKSLSLLRLFETIEFQLSIQNDDYTEYDGRTPAEVVEHYNEKRSLFSFTLFAENRQRIQLSPFEEHCIGIATKQPYSVSLQQMKIDIDRVAILAASVALLWYSGRLAKNSLFYYLAGIMLGICSSFLIIIVFMAKLLPKRPMMYGILIGGWTIGIYLLQQLLDNIQLILVSYYDYVLGYLAITGLISFLICYRIGPPRNARSQNIVTWVLQAMAFGLAYFSTWHQSFVLIMMTFICLIYYLPLSLRTYLTNYYRRCFPTKRRLLTQEEYYNESVRETERSLCELRAYVNSPKCRQWSIISRLDNPQRFAQFAQGAPHLYNDEIEDYSRTIEGSLDGADDQEEYLNSTMYYRSPAWRNVRSAMRSTPINRTPHYESAFEYNEQTDNDESIPDDQ